MEREVFENGELPRRESHIHAIASDEAGTEVDHHGSKHQRRSGLPRGAPDERSRARVTPEGRKAHEIIVSASAEAAHPVGGVVACGEHQHGRRLPSPETFEDLPTIDLREHYIEHDGVVIVACREVQTVRAILCGIDGITFLAERFGETPEEADFIFDEEDAPGGSAWRCHALHEAEIKNAQQKKSRPA